MNMDLYLQLVAEKFISAIVLFGALNWGFIGVFRFNLLSFIAQRFTSLRINRILYTIIGLCALSKFFQRDYYLPFLGRAVFPCDSLVLKTPENADTITNVKVRKNSNVIYWASQGTSAEDIIAQNPSKAYDKFANAGVALSDNKGNAQLKFKFPVRYRIPTGSVLKPHVHYRVCRGNGMLTPIKTIFLK